MNQKLQKIKGALGIPSQDVKIVYPKEFLKKFDELIAKLDQVNDKKIGDFLAKISQLFIEQANNVAKLNERLDTIDTKVSREIIIPDPPEYPKEIDIKKPEWYKDFPLEEIRKYIQGIKLPQFNGKEESAPFYLNGDGVVIPGIPDKSIYVYALKLVTSQAMAVNWRDGLDYDIEGPQHFVANGGYTESILPPGCLFSTRPGNSLSLIVTNNKKNGYAGGRVSYWVE